MEIFFYVYFLMFSSGLIVFSIKHKHLLLMLLTLEVIVLSVYMVLYFYLNFFFNGNFINMIFLTFSVCEGVLGLSIMISLVRTHGNDYFQSFNLLW